MSTFWDEQDYEWFPDAKLLLFVICQDSYDCPNQVIWMCIRGNQQAKPLDKKKNIHVISTCCSVPNQKTNPFYPLCACFATSDKWKTCYQNRKLKAISVDPLTDTCFSIYLFGNAKTLAPCRTNVRVANKLQTTQLIEQFRMGKTNQSWTQYIFYRIGYDMAFFCMIFPLWVREYNFIICLWFIHNVFVCVCVC